MVDIMWEDYIPGTTPPRPITVSQELYDAVEQFSKDKGYTMQAIFNIALISLWRTWNGNTETNESKDAIAEMKVRDIFINSDMPGHVVDKKYIHLAFRGDMTFEWICKMEKLGWCRGIYDGIRRILTWFLTDQGYLGKKKKGDKPIPDDA